MCVAIPAGKRKEFNGNNPLTFWIFWFHQLRKGDNLDAMNFNWLKIKELFRQEVFRNNDLDSSEVIRNQLDLL